MDSPSPRAAPRFDSNRAWQQALAAISANREVLLALAGVFFLLPGLAFSLLFPQPTPPAGADQKAAAAYLMDYYGRMLPYALPVFVMQAGGTLGMLTLLTDRRRPTVAEAIRTGFGAILPYLASQLIVGFVMGMVAVLIMVLFVMLNAKSFGVLAMLMMLVYAIVCTSLAAPVIAVEGVRNPIRALTRSWQLVRGNSLRLAFFLVLVLVASSVVVMVITALGGTLLGLLLPQAFAVIGAAVISATLGALLALIFVAILASTHAQLSGPEAQGA